MRRFLYIFLISAICTSCIPSHPRHKIAEHNETQKGSEFTSTRDYAGKIQVTDSQLYHDTELIKYKGYTVSYNKKHKIPNWVYYELLASETDGPYSRNGKDFRQDSSVKVPQANDNDYKRSGWSRGHMAPAGDFKWSEDAMWDTFYYTNCCPQNLRLNQGQWETLEEKARGWARSFGRVIIITGPIIGNNINGTIGKSQIVIPDAFFKAVRTDKQAIAFIMYNHNNNANLQKCAMSIDDLEQITGFDLFSELDDATENQIESSYQLKYWNL